MELDTLNLVSVAFTLANKLAAIMIDYVRADAEKRAELLAEAETDFQAYLTLMKTFDMAIAQINAEVDRELQKEPEKT